MDLRPVARNGSQPSCTENSSPGRTRHVNIDACMTSPRPKRLAFANSWNSQLWIFTLDLWFCAGSGASDVAPTRALKILHKSVNAAESASLEESNTIETLRLPEHAYDDLQKVLLENQLILPDPSRSYQGWNVTLLRRFRNIDG